MTDTKKHIYIIGPSGVGKTTVGAQVAEKLGLDFIDMDDYIADKVGVGISEYFSLNGEQAFREIERQCVQELAALAENKVIASGGGTVLDARNIVAMKSSGYIFYLSAFQTDIVERLQKEKGSRRPLLAGDLKEKVNEQFVARKECYELASDVEIATSNRDVDTIADALIRQYKQQSSQTVNSTSSIVVGTNLYERFGELVPNYSTYVVISEPGIPEQFRKQIKDSLRESNVVECLIETGEAGKSFESYKKVIQEMSNSKVTRNSCVIALGGGVVGDLAGFVASTYHRGIDVIQVPTTLLAQVDSSIGGKCAINLESGKNLVGSFHQPKIIVADTSAIDTLSDADFLSGLGEVAKYALLGNATVSDLINDSSKEILNRNPEVLTKLIRSCMNHKVHIVAKDPLERNGIRATLNLGHTLAHALETATNYTIPHGVAVVLGMRFIADLSCELGRITQAQRTQINSLLDKLELEKQLPSGSGDASELLELMYSDKKSEGGLSFILLDEQGRAELVHDVDKEKVLSVLTNFIADCS